MSWDKQVTCSTFLAGIYSTFSDSLTTCFIKSRSQLGPYLVHNMSFFGALSGGMITSLLADKTQSFISNNLFSSRYRNSSFIQLSTRALVHVGVGAVLGLGASILAPALEIKVATGVALGVAAFIGPQLGLLIYKTIQYVLKTFFYGKPIWKLENSEVQKSVFEASEKKDNASEVEICKILGLKSTAEAVKETKDKFDWATIYSDILTIEQQIKQGECSDSLLALYKGMKHFNPKAKEESCKRLGKGIEGMATVIINNYKINKQLVGHDLLKALSMNIAYALLYNLEEDIKKHEYQYIANASDDALIKINKTDVDLINAIYDKVRPLIKD